MFKSVTKLPTAVLKLFTEELNEVVVTSNCSVRIVSVCDTLTSLELITSISSLVMGLYSWRLLTKSNIGVATSISKSTAGFWTTSYPESNGGEITLFPL